MANATRHSAPSNRTVPIVTACVAVFATAALAQSSTFTPPWMLGDELAVQCYTLDRQPIAQPAGLRMRWDTALPATLLQTTQADANYSVTIDDAVFWGDAANAALLGAEATQWRRLCNASATVANTGCTAGATASSTCCVWHANLHSCRQSTGSTCEPWITPQNASVVAGCNADDAARVLVTHTSAQVGVPGAYSQGLQLPAGSWVTIAHVKIMNFQCAVGALRRSIVPPPAAAGRALSDGAVAAIAVCAAALVAGVAALVARAALGSAGARDVSNAPLCKRGESATIVFTDIQDSTQLWANYTLSTAAALDTHHRVVRAAIAAHGGYEVKTVGDAFMVACRTPGAAVAIARDIQLGLLREAWPRCVCEHYDGVSLEDKPSDVVTPEVLAASESTVPGLRVRIGLHTGTPDAVFDEVSKGYDYYGPDVNLAARVEAAAVGGQILASAAALAALGGAAELEALRVAKTGEGQAELKGIDGPVTLVALEPTELPALRNLAIRTDGRGDGGVAVTEGSIVNDAADDAKSVMTHAGAADTEAVAEGITRRLHVTLFSAHTLAEVAALVDERKRSLETLLVPLPAGDKEKVLQLLAKGWRTTAHGEARRERSILELVARVLPAEQRGRAELAASFGAKSNSNSAGFTGNWSFVATSPAVAAAAVEPVSPLNTPQKQNSTRN